nr:MAG TPA: Malcavernin protein [Caudoviricetes sp.]
MYSGPTEGRLITQSYGRIRRARLSTTPRNGGGGKYENAQCSSFLA